MRKFFLLLVMFSVALGGCGDVEWFPEQGVSQFSFDPVVDVSPGTVVTSNTITVETPNASETISISDGAYSINGAEYTTTSGTVEDGDQVTVQHQAATAPGGEVESELTIGYQSGTFRSTAGTPVQFDQPAILNATPSTVTTSSEETVILAGDSAPISITGGSYSLDNGGFVSDAGTVKKGQKIRVQHITAASGTTGAASTKVTELTVGQLKSTFSTSVTPVLTVTAEASGTTGTEVITQVPSLVSGNFELGIRETDKGFATVALSLNEEPWDSPPKPVTLRAGQPIFISETVFPSTAEIVILRADQTVVQRINYISRAQ